MASPTRVRSNVLLLFLMGYIAVGVLFAAVVGAGGSVGSATDATGAALMALIGGSLTIAKDLINTRAEGESAQRSP